MARGRKYLLFRVDRRRRHRRLAVVKFQQREATAMPKLTDEHPDRVMYGIGDQTPAGDLLVRPDLKRERISSTFG